MPTQSDVTEQQFNDEDAMRAIAGPRAIAPGSLYRRELPGGGYVLIQVDDGGNVACTRVWVERRGGSDRRRGHTPVVIAEINGDAGSGAFAEAYRVASDNVAIARRLLAIAGRDD